MAGAAFAHGFSRLSPSRPRCRVSAAANGERRAPGFYAAILTILERRILLEIAIDGEDQALAELNFSGLVFKASGDVNRERAAACCEGSWFGAGAGRVRRSGLALRTRFRRVGHDRPARTVSGRVSPAGRRRHDLMRRLEYLENLVEGRGLQRKPDS